MLRRSIKGLQRAVTATTNRRQQSVLIISRKQHQVAIDACRPLRAIFPEFCRSFSSEVKSQDAAQETFEFQAETRKLLDIVTNSIYTDKEVFIRELLSNASDSLEKLRYKTSTGELANAGDMPLEIIIETSADNKTLTIMDSGIGMTKEELISNLGTIARSGSKQFVEKIKSSGGSSASTTDNIIGQFGVGFYSSFMVSDNVVVESKAAGESAASGNLWSSDGSGMYSIAASSEGGIARGCKVVMHLKKECHEFLDPKRIKDIVKRYSNFVPFPIKLNGEQINTVTAIWTADKAEVTEAQYKEFYKFISQAYDDPMFTLHFRTDAPLDLKVLFFTPSMHTEKFGMGRMDPGVNLYSRKVLIESKPKDLLPEWLRFIKGVVDSEDLPLSLSRERPQDSQLLKRIKDVLTRKYLRFLEEKAKNDPAKYREFYIEFSFFLKEGACQDYKFQEQIAKLLLYETDKGKDDDLCSLEEYISRCPPEQKNIYYLIAPNRDTAMKSPYYETFKRHGTEVLLMYNTIDDFLMSSLKKFSGRDLISAESSVINLELDGGKKTGESNVDSKDDSSGTEEKKVESVTELPEVDSAALCSYLKTVLGSKVRDVKITKRLADSPAIITDHESGAVRRMMRLVDQANAGKTAALPPQVLEINPKHPLIVNLSAASAVGGGNEDIASKVAAQLFDNACIAAGLIDDPRSMLSRLNEILAHSIKK